MFVAHTVEAWEFAEAEFFQVSGSGGTVASTAFRKVLDIATDRFDPSRFNTYVFYASDGANFHNDREAAQAALTELGGVANYIGYVETASVVQQPLQSETALLFERLQAGHGRRRPARVVVAGVGVGRDSRRSSARRVEVEV